MKDNILLYGIAISSFTVLFIIVIIIIIRAVRKKKLKKELDKLDVEKNKISSTPIIPELAKIEGYRSNEKLNVMYNEWKNRFDDISEVQIPKISDMLLEATYTLSQKDYKSTIYKIAKLEMEIYKVRTTAEYLLEEIRQVTTS